MLNLLLFVNRNLHKITLLLFGMCIFISIVANNPHIFFQTVYAMNIDPEFLNLNYPRDVVIAVQGMPESRINISHPILNQLSYKYDNWVSNKIHELTPQDPQTVFTSKYDLIDLSKTIGNNLFTIDLSNLPAIDLSNLIEAQVPFSRERWDGVLRFRFSDPVEYYQLVGRPYQLSHGFLNCRIEILYRWR